MGKPRDVLTKDLSGRAWHSLNDLVERPSEAVSTICARREGQLLEQGLGHQRGRHRGQTGQARDQLAAPHGDQVPTAPGPGAD